MAQAPSQKKEKKKPTRINKNLLSGVRRQNGSYKSVYWDEDYWRKPSHDQEPVHGQCVLHKHLRK